MGYPTRVQLINRKASQQWYVNFPSALAQALEFSRGETVEWVIEDRSQLLLNRRQVRPGLLWGRRLCSSSPATPPDW